MKPQRNGSPGSHPHADRRNWKPAETIDEYLQNCREGLEDYSQRKAAGLWRVSRSELQRWELMAEIPEPLFEALLAAPRVPSTTALAGVARALRGTPGKADMSAARIAVSSCGCGRAFLPSMCGSLHIGSRNKEARNHERNHRPTSA